MEFQRHSHGAIDRVEEIWQASNWKIVNILNDLLKKGILFEPKPAIYKIL
jgi:hypothetical protein